MTSVIVVTNTLDAIAGSIFIFFKVTGTKYQISLQQPSLVSLKLNYER